MGMTAYEQLLAEQAPTRRAAHAGQPAGTINDRNRTARLNRARDMEVAIGRQEREMLAALRDLALRDDDRELIEDSIQRAAERARERLAREVEWDAASLEWETALVAAQAGDAEALRKLPATAARLFAAAGA